jgi:hypothetical protein
LKKGRDLSRAERAAGTLKSERSLKMSKEKGKITDIPVTRTPDMCKDFSGNPGDPVDWENIPPTGCTISQNGSNNTFPFSPAQGSAGSYYITLPAPSTITIASGLSAGKYTFIVSCCSTESATHSVDVGGK